VGQPWAGSGSGPLLGSCSNIYFDQDKRPSLGLPEDLVDLRVEEVVTAVDAVAVDGEQDRDAVPGPGGDLSQADGPMPVARITERVSRLGAGPGVCHGRSSADAAGITRAKRHDQRPHRAGEAFDPRLDIALPVDTTSAGIRARRRGA
jgi:hypothetical protein